jgi:hypothetical protein
MLDVMKIKRGGISHGEEDSFRNDRCHGGDILND